MQRIEYLKVIIWDTEVVDLSRYDRKKLFYLTASLLYLQVRLDARLN